MRHYISAAGGHARVVVSASTVLGLMTVSGANGTQVDLELALLADMSGSVDQEGFGLQRQGYIDAFRDPSVASAIQSGGQFGSIAVSLVYWDSSPSQIVPWTLIDGSSGNTAADFAQAVEDDTATYFDFGGGTDMTDAINAIARSGADGSIDSFDENSFDGLRNVIDLSTDGSPNNDASAAQAADDALAGSVDTINAIGIASADVEFLENNIVGGADSFVVTAEGFDDFAATILQKLLEEITGNAARTASLDNARQIVSSHLDIARQVSHIQWTNLGWRLEGRRSARQGAVILAQGGGPAPANSPVAAGAFATSDGFFGRGFDTAAQDAPPAEAESSDSADEPLLPDRPLGEGAERFGTFASVRGVVGEHQAGPGDENYYSVGGTAGIDFRLGDDLVLGVAGGYDRSDVDLPNDGDLILRAPSLSVYGTWTPTEALYVDGAFTYAHLNIDQERRFRTGAGAIGEATSEFTGNQYALQGRVGYDFTFDRWILGPVLGASYIHTDLDDYSETGTAPLMVESQDADSLRSRLGGQVSYVWERDNDQRIVPQFRFAWVHEFMDDGRTIGGQFLNAPTNAVVIPSSNPDRNFFEVGAGVSAKLRENVSVYANYDVVVGNSDYDAHMMSAGVRLMF